MKLYQTAEFGVYNDKVVKCTLSCKLVYVDGYGEEYFQTVGIAKCHEEDTFNLELGKKLAEAKAAKKAYETTLRYLENFRKGAYKIIDELNEDIERADEMLITEEKHLSNILKDVH